MTTTARAKRGRRWAGAVLVLLTISVTVLPAAAAERWSSLAGEWRFSLDSKGEGEAQHWAARRLDDTIHLPGTTDEQRKGPRNEAVELQRLTRLHPYSGAAWYQRDFVVSAEWVGKRMVLVLERTKNTRLFLDDADLGEQDSLVAPHEYVLPALKAGPHRLTVRVDNARIPPVGDPHQVSDQTQTNWNGILGEVGLRITDPVWIEDMQIYPDLVTRKARVRVEIGALGGVKVEGTLRLEVGAGGVSRGARDNGTGDGRGPSGPRGASDGREAADGHSAAPPRAGLPLTVPFATKGESTVVEVEYTLGPGVQPWDEFSPRLHTLSAVLDVPRRGYSDRSTVRFGLREFVARGTQFRINGRTTFLRGKQDACVFPLTGYAPMTVEEWRRVLGIAQTWGINHYRFHTWCPPRAAFEAADELGIYMQPELPNWAAFGESAHDDFLRREGERILRSFGNHPSFVMLSLGNELGGKQELMAPFVSLFRSLDPRHLYAQGTNNWFPGPGEGDDYFASFQVAGQKVRGSFATVDAPLGHVQTGPPGTTKDYTAQIAATRVPVVGHEIGEYQSAPDYREIPKYTGVVRARNLEAFRARAEKAGLLDSSDTFFKASGALATLSYREDIEAALRTRGFGGFQLLDLQDFPGQGTALVGILDAFMDSKGFITPEAWRRFCSETVPLLRFPKYTWTVGETFVAQAEVAHYGPADLTTTPIWTARQADGTIISTGRLPALTVPQGTLTPLGEIRFALKGVVAPARVEVEVALEGSSAVNSYQIWVYPEHVDTSPGQVLVRRSLDQATLEALANGGRVLLVPVPSALSGAIVGSFAPDFWNYGMFRKFAEERHVSVAPGTLGIACNPSHPAFGSFPTDSHSNWQWFHLLQASRAVILDDLPGELQPIVHVIDNAERAHRLGAVFEARVGRGRLLVSAIDLVGLSDRPEARQLLSSLLRYANSEAFEPKVTLGVADLQKTLAP